MTELGGIDLTPLSRPVSAREARAAGYPGSPLSVSVIMPIVIIAVTAFMCVQILSIGTRGQASTPIIVFALLGAAGMLWFVLAMATRQNRRSRQLFMFAKQNDLDFEEKVLRPAHAGIIFGVGGGRLASNIVTTRGHYPTEFASYQYTIGSGKSQQTVAWDYVRIQLRSALPNIVLDARSNNVFGSNLPARLDKNQRLSLEGDFDRYFTLYCPTGYETDALYLFTPDVMVNFSEGAKEFDVEIIDNQLFLYSKGNADRTDPDVWRWQLRAVAAVVEKIEQWERWRDDRLHQPPAHTAQQAEPPHADDMLAEDAKPAAMPQVAPAPHAIAAQADPFQRPSGVAPEGRRLRRKSNTVLIVVLSVATILLLLLRF